MIQKNRSASLASRQQQQQQANLTDTSDDSKTTSNNQTTSSQQQQPQPQQIDRSLFAFEPKSPATTPMYLTSTPSQVNKPRNIFFAAHQQVTDSSKGPSVMTLAMASQQQQSKMTSQDGPNSSGTLLPSGVVLRPKTQGRKTLIYFLLLLFYFPH